MDRTRRWRGSAAVFLSVAMLSGPSLATVARASVTAASTAASAPRGLRVFTMNGRRFGITTAIHVMTFTKARYRIRIALAHHAIDGGVQTPRSMCVATPGCVAAVNGDFFAMTRRGVPDPGDEVGAIIQNCVLLHTPEISHQQANLNGRSVSQGLDWSDTLDVNGTSVAITAINQELPMAYVNVHLAVSGTLLFTAPYALRTPSAPGRVTYEFALVGGGPSATSINSTAQLQLVDTTTRAVKVRVGEVYISAPWGSPLASLHLGQTIYSKTLSTGGCNDIGGHPILINQGVAVPIVAADTYMARPFARTVIGWTATGRTLLMTVDGRDGVSGASAPQLVAVLRALKVVTALDLDGGNSTTFFAKGRTLNHPSQGFERPVSTALVVVANSPSK